MPPDLIYSMFLAFDDYHPLWSFWHGKKVKLKQLVACHTEVPNAFPQNQKTIFRYLKKLRSDVIEKDPANVEREVVKQSSFFISGQVRYMKEEQVLRIKCLHGHVEFEKIAIWGKKTMTASQFYNGYLSKVSFEKRFFQ